MISNKDHRIFSRMNFILERKALFQLCFIVLFIGLLVLFTWIIIKCVIKSNNNNNESFSSLMFLPQLYFINLKDRKDRKTRVIQQMNNVNYPLSKINRVDAIKESFNGALGCTKSHIKALKQALKQAFPYVLIIEDDFIWKKSNSKNKIIQTLNKIINDNNWDVCLLAGNPAVPNTQRNEYSKKVNKSMTTSAYIVKKEYIPKLLEMWEPSITAKPFVPLDVLWFKLQENDNWIITNPVLGYQGRSYSDVENGLVDYKV